MPSLASFDRIAEVLVVASSTDVTVFSSVQTISPLASAMLCPVKLKPKTRPDVPKAATRFLKVGFMKAEYVPSDELSFIRSVNLGKGPYFS